MPHPLPHHFVDGTHCMPMLLSDFGKTQKPHKNLRNTNLPLRLSIYTVMLGHPRMPVSAECWVAVLTQDTEQTTQCVKEDINTS